MRQAHARALRVLAVVTAALLALGASALIGWTGPDQGKAVAERPEGSNVPGPDDVVEQAPASVPAAIPSSRTFSCPAGTRAFQNPALHYRLCYPQDWGFSDFTKPDRLDKIPGVQLENLHLLSSEAFPWPEGSQPFDVLVQRGAIDVELNLLQPGVRSTDECEPAKARTSGDLTILTCTQAYDVFGVPAEAGPVTAVKFAVPLVREPTSLNTDLELAGSKLLVVVRTATTRALKEGDLGWKLVRSIRPY